MTNLSITSVSGYARWKFCLFVTSSNYNELPVWQVEEAFDRFTLERAKTLLLLLLLRLNWILHFLSNYKTGKMWKACKSFSSHNIGNWMKREKIKFSRRGLAGAKSNLILLFIYFFASSNNWLVLLVVKTS